MDAVLAAAEVREERDGAPYGRVITLPSTLGDLAAVHIHRSVGQALEVCARGRSDA
jgi:hypothetical protein